MLCRLFHLDAGFLLLLTEQMATHLFINTVNHVDDIVAQFLTLAHDVHIEDASLIRLLLLADILNVLGAELIAVVVDLTFLVIAAHQVVGACIVNVA